MHAEVTNSSFGVLLRPNGLPPSILSSILPPRHCSCPQNQLCRLMHNWPHAVCHRTTGWSMLLRLMIHRSKSDATDWKTQVTNIRIHTRPTSRTPGKLITANKQWRAVGPQHKQTRQRQRDREREEIKKWLAQRKGNKCGRNKLGSGHRARLKHQVQMHKYAWILS